jgi:hypothetical protein
MSEGTDRERHGAGDQGHPTTGVAPGTAPVIRGPPRHGAVTSETVAFLDTPLPDMGAAAAEAWGIHNWSPQR